MWRRRNVSFVCVLFSPKFSSLLTKVRLVRCLFYSKYTSYIHAYSGSLYVMACVLIIRCIENAHI